MNISGLVHINLTFENICIGFVTDSNEETCCSDTVLVTSLVVFYSNTFYNLFTKNFNGFSIV